MASTQKVKKNSVLFVCLGNICRSTMAEAILQHLVKQRNLKDEWHIDSAATGTWNIGSPPDPRTMKELNKNGINDYKHTGRLLTREDFTTFDYIFGMDDDNIIDIEEVNPKNSTAKILLLGNYDPQKVKIIEDPYFTVHTNKNAFIEVYDQCLRCCTAFLDSVQSS